MRKQQPFFTDDLSKVTILTYHKLNDGSYALQMRIKLRQGPSTHMLFKTELNKENPIAGRIRISCSVEDHVSVINDLVFAATGFKFNRADKQDKDGVIRYYRADRSDLN